MTLHHHVGGTLYDGRFGPRACTQLPDVFGESPIVNGWRN